MQQMQQQMAQMDQQLSEKQSDIELQRQKLEIEMFNAQTNRAKAMKEINPVQQGQEVVQNDLSEADKIQLEAMAKIELERVKIEGQKELELLRQRLSNTNEEIEYDEDNNQMPSAMAQHMLTLAQQMERLQGAMSAPRVLIRDENGKPIGSRMAE